jgi:hypothetical protein
MSKDEVTELRLTDIWVEKDLEAWNFALSNGDVSDLENQGGKMIH